MKKNVKRKSESENESVSRRSAITRMGLAAASAASMMLLLNNPAKAQLDDTSTEPGDPFG